MNIFVLSTDPVLAARYLADKHVVKMTLESAQLLCGVFYFNSQLGNIPYRLTHKNHPCSKWARESMENFNWLLSHFEGLLSEYAIRYGKVHKCQEIHDWIIQHKAELAFSTIGMSSFALAMPEEYRTDNAVYSYREYYIKQKVNTGIAVWNKTAKPSWIRGDRNV